MAVSKRQQFVGSFIVRMSTRITSPSQLTLNDVDTRLGFEKARFKAGNEETKVTCVIHPLADLSIYNSVEFQLIMPPTYCQAGGLRVCILDRNSLEFFRSLSLLKNDNELIISWLDNTKYTLAVWFFAVRDYFKVPTLDKWTASILLRAEFRNIRNKKLSEVTNTTSEKAKITLISGCGKTRGKRNYMEDVDFVFESIKISDKHSVSVFGVLDGHGGKECAQFAAEDIPIKIATYLRNGMSCPESLYKSFVETDKEFLESAIGGNSGSTANVIVYDKPTNVFYVANTADTRAILCRNAVAHDLSMDRKASDPEEIARIAKAGGFVVSGRVLGSLAVSRALGDAQIKNHKAGVLLADPEVSCFRPTARDEFIVVATDGLWDVLSSQAVVDFVRGMLTAEDLLDVNNGKSKEQIVEKLNYIANHTAVHAVSNLNSMDNVTVMIILIQGGEEAAGVDEEEQELRHNTELTAIAAQSASSMIYYGNRAATTPSPSFSNATNGYSQSPVTLIDDTPASSAPATVIFKKQSAIERSHSTESSPAAARGIAFDPMEASVQQAEFVFHAIDKPNSSSKGVVSGGSTLSGKIVKTLSADEEEDDLMDFLKDDSNF